MTSIQNLHDGNRELQRIGDDLMGAAATCDLVLSAENVSGSSGVPRWIRTLGRDHRAATVLSDGTRRGRVEVDIRLLHVGNRREIGWSSAKVAATIKGCILLAIAHDEGTLDGVKCRNGIPRAESGIEGLVPMFQRGGVKLIRGPTGHYNRFAPIDPTDDMWTKAKADFAALASQLHGLVMLDRNGNELSIGKSAEKLAELCKAASKDRSKSASKKTRAETADASAEVATDAPATEKAEASADSVETLGDGIQAAMEDSARACGVDPSDSDAFWSFVAVACVEYAEQHGTAKESRKSA